MKRLNLAERKEAINRSMLSENLDIFGEIYKTTLDEGVEVMKQKKEKLDIRIMLWSALTLGYQIRKMEEEKNNE